MQQHNTTAPQRKWYDSAHSSLCVLGRYLRQIGFFAPLEQRMQIRQKVLKYSPIQKVEMLFVGRLSGAKAVSHTATTVRVDPALTAAFGATLLCRPIGDCRDAGCGYRSRCGGPGSGTR